MWDTGTDLDALITVEVLFVTPFDEKEETLQVANIQFNNLDIIGKRFVTCLNERSNLDFCYFYSSQPGDDRRAHWIRKTRLSPLGRISIKYFD